MSGEESSQSAVSVAGYSQPDWRTFTAPLQNTILRKGWKTTLYFQGELFLPSSKSVLQVNIYRTENFQRYFSELSRLYFVQRKVECHLKKIRKLPWPILTQYFWIWLERLWKTKDSSQVSRSAGLQYNLGLHRYETGVLFTIPRHSIERLRSLVVMIVCLRLHTSISYIRT